MRAARWFVLTLAACGAGDAEVIHLAGSPEATRAVAFDAEGGLVAIGGPSSFGLASLQQLDGERWIRAEGVAGFGARAQLLGGGDGLPLYAISDATLYRLDDVAAFRWSAFPIPLGVTDGTLFGVAASGALYGLDLSEGDGNGAVVTWTPGDVRWAELAGTRPMGVAARGYAVEPSGRVSWIVPEAGVVRVEDGVQATVVDCHAEGLADCTSPIDTLTYDARGNLTFLVCPALQPPRVAMRLAAGATVPVQAAIPASDVACHALVTAADGTSLLATLDDSGETGALSVWDDGEDGWSRIAPSTKALRYVIRDGGTAFGYGDALGERGIYRVEF